METRPLRASSRLTVPQVLAQIAMQSGEASCILVLHHRKLMGVVTHQSLIQAIAQCPHWQEMQLAQIVKSPAATVSSSDLQPNVDVLASLLEKFTHHRTSYLPVIDDDEYPVGLIHARQLLQAMQVLPPLTTTSKIENYFTPVVPSEELQRQQQHAQLLAEITLKIRQSLQLEEILSTAVGEVQRLLKADRVLIYQVFANGTGKTISEAVVAPYPAILGMSFPEEVFPEEYQTLYAQGRVQAIADVRAPDSGLTDCLVEFIEQWAVRSKLIVPIVHPLKPELSVGNAPLRQHLWGLLIAHQCRGSRQWSEFELDLMQQLADQLSIAISHGQMVKYLEERVKLRTAELTQANRALHQEIREREQVEAALRQSEEQLRLITNNLPVLIAYVDRHQCYRFNNQAYQHWFGQAPKDIYGQPMKALIGADYHQTIQSYIEMALAGEQVTYESELTLKDGRRHSVSVTYIPHIETTEEAAPQVRGFFALTTDISDRTAIERMKDEFIAVVSHELRTPLTSIHGSLKLVATGRLGHLSEEGQQMLEVADENTDRLVRLINSVLDLQRIESGEVTMDTHACEVTDLIEEAIETMRAIAQQHDIELQTQSAPISIWADPDYIVQTLTNLLSNAIKFSAPGNVIRLTVRANFEPAQLPQPSTTQSHYPMPMAMALFCVQDDGQGIPADKLNSIFERFQQVDSSDSRKKGGTGLGLAICRKIVEQHGGQIWAESQMGVGSCFYFTVPLYSTKEA